MYFKNKVFQFLYESKKPSFRSDRYQFTVIMPNLNYEFTESVTQDVTQDNMDDQIVELIRKNNKISTDEIAKTVGVSSRTIKRHIKEKENIEYVGSGYSGHWKITE